MDNYLSIFLFLCTSAFISTLLVIIPYFLAVRTADPEKLTSYECGFEPFADARNKHDVHFYLIAILFIIVDIEMIFIFPWVYNLNRMSFIAMMLFLIIFIVGYIYEWRKGALNW